MSHKCPVKTCKALVSNEMLLCKPHWWMVPPALRSEVRWCYRYGAKEAHLSACAQAIKAVDKLEAKR